MNCKKIISALLVLTMTGTLAAGLAACKNDDDNIDNPPDNTPKGRVIYVSPDGQYGAAGTEDDPCAADTTLRDTDLKPGDTVLFMPGVYNIDHATQIRASGAYNNYITFKRADPTKETVLSFYDMAFSSSNRGVQVYGDYIHWDGIDIRGAGDNGMYIGSSYNIVENCRFYDNRDTGLQLGRNYSPKTTTIIVDSSTGETEDIVEHAEYDDINYWPNYNLIKNCTSFNNYDNETYGENADGFAAKLTVGYGNVFDGCIAYRNSDDGWDLFAKTDSGNIGQVIMYNCVAFENGYIQETQEEFNKKFRLFNVNKAEKNQKVYTTNDGDGNGFKLGGSVMEGEVLLYNCLSYHNRMHGVTDNSNPGVISIDGVTSYNNGVGISSDGKISYKSNNNVDGGCGNIDLARQTYSYNHVANSLAVNNGNPYTSDDAYRGTVENTTFAMKDSAVKYTVAGQAEYNSKTGDRGTKGSAAPATSIFKALPALDMGFEEDLHMKLRNSDMSINMGEILALIDQSSTQGCKLSEGSWDSYTHYGMTDLTTLSSEEEANAQAVIDMVYLPVRTQACYQSFDAVTKIKNTVITWTSSNSSLIEVTDQKGTSHSHHEDVRMKVKRPLERDEKVTLTATVTVGSVTKTKSFEINVKQNTFRVGEFRIEGLNENSIIQDKGENFYDYAPPVPVITNGTSESGDVIPDDGRFYSVDRYVKLATVPSPDWNNSSHYENRDRFDASVPGIWQITETVTLKEGIALAKPVEGDNGGVPAEGQTEVAKAPRVVSKVYLIYISARDAQVDFMNKTSVMSVYKDGYLISGSFTSPTGSIYSLTLPASAAAPTVEAIKANANTTKYEFRATNGQFSFRQANTEDYNIFYFLESLDGTQHSEVYRQEVRTKKIANKTDFENMLQNNNSSTVYLLTADIDFGGSVNCTNTEFKGVFNGQGHKLSNFHIAKTEKSSDYSGLFRKVKGGTIMNLLVENASVKDEFAGTRVGFIGQMEGGYVSNIRVHNLDLLGGERVGFIGQIFASAGTGTENVIDRICITADKDADGNFLHSFTATSQRVGGIVGLIQDASAGSGWTETYISNCLVNAHVISANRYAGGIVGRSDDRNKKDLLEITTCVFNGVNTCEQMAGGILGCYTNNAGPGTVRIYSCVGVGKMIYTKDKVVQTVVDKNCSNIVGNYPSTGEADVRNCYAMYADHCANHDVTVYGARDDNGFTNYAIFMRDAWEKYLTSADIKVSRFSTVFDFENIWEIIVDEKGDVVAPYIRMK